MNSSTFIKRRTSLRQALLDGAILLMGQNDASRNYPANPYPFRQDSHFLYYMGINLPGMAALVEPDGTAVLFGAPDDPDDLIWHGPHPVLADHAEHAGITQTAEIGQLKQRLNDLQGKGVPIHYLPSYRGDSTLTLAGLLGIDPAQVNPGASQALARAVVEQRSIKTDDEIAEIEEALGISAKMYDAALKLTAPGKTEAEIAGAMQGVALAHDSAQSFLPIVSVRGEVLHNNSYKNTLKSGELLLVDSGCESSNFYASDITRTIPVSGRYTSEQRDIYQVVLNAQLAAIEAASPSLSNKELHLISARTIASGLIELGLMKGDPEQAVQEGAHALFFPHGLGHMIGIDVHDMEDLGDVVGYPEDQRRSNQFGLSFLRLAKSLKPGFAITVEPGTYFIPALIDQWSKENKLASFINYEKVQQFRGFGGVRIEDVLVITETGCRVLGPPIPKTIDEVENAMAR